MTPLSDVCVDPDDARCCFGCGARLADEAVTLGCWYCPDCAPLGGGSKEYQLYEFPACGPLYRKMLAFRREVG